MGKQEQFQDMLPDTHKTFARKQIMDVIREVPDQWGVLSDGEKDRISARVDAAVTAISDWLGMRLQTVIADERAHDRIAFQCTGDAINIKKEAVKVTLVVPKQDAPAELFQHVGRYLVILTEGQMDLLARADAADPSSPEEQAPSEETPGSDQ